MASTVSLGMLGLVLFLGLLGGPGGVEARSDEQRVIKHLLEEYEPLARPVSTINDTLNVAFGLAPIQILRLDEGRQTFSALVWYKMTWKDMSLTWDPSAYGKVDRVQIPSTSIFLPDIVAYSELPQDTTVMKTLVVVKSDGTVIWVPSVQLTTTCPDLAPGVDEVTCDFKIGSWTRDVGLMNITEYGQYIDFTDYSPNAYWELVDSSAVRKVVYYECCPEGYVHVKYSFKLRRIREPRYGRQYAAANAGQAYFSLSLLSASILYSLL